MLPCVSVFFLTIILSSEVVCYVADRNELRRRVIDWLQTEVVPDGWFTKGSNFTDLLLKYFKVCADSHLQHQTRANLCSEVT